MRHNITPPGNYTRMNRKLSLYVMQLYILYSYIDIVVALRGEFFEQVVVHVTHVLCGLKLP